MLVAGLAVVMSVGIIALIPTAIVSVRLWRALQSRHPEVWRADPEVDSCARILRVLDRLLTAAVWVGAVLVLLLAASAGRHAGAAIAFPCCLSTTAHASTMSLAEGTMLNTDN